jgi:uncharacterized membrane protein
MKPKNHTQEELHRLFVLSLFLKAVSATLETMGGIFLLFIKTTAITSAILFFGQGELTDDPKDFLVNFLVQLANDVSVKGKLFAALYLLSHGIVKMVLVYALYKKKLWAYPASIIVLILFILYQIYLYTHTPSIWLIILTVFDFILIGLIYNEYRSMRSVFTTAPIENSDAVDLASREQLP